MKKRKAITAMALIFASVIVIFGLSSCTKEDTSVKETTVNEVTEGITATEEETTEQESVTAETTEDKTGKSAEAFRDSVESEYGIISAWCSADYDSDGAEEAFVVISDAVGEESSIIETLYVDDNGDVTVMEKDNERFYVCYYGTAKATEYEGQIFFSCDTGAFGSGWSTMLYSVKDSKPYILELSCRIQSFDYHNGKFVTTENEFRDPGGHFYPYVELLYSDGEFVKGEKTGEYWQG